MCANGPSSPWPYRPDPFPASRSKQSQVVPCSRGLPLLLSGPAAVQQVEEGPPRPPVCRPTPLPDKGPLVLDGPELCFSCLLSGGKLMFQDAG